MTSHGAVIVLSGTLQPWWDNGGRTTVGLSSSPLTERYSCVGVGLCKHALHCDRRLQRQLAETYTELFRGLARPNATTS